MLAFQRSHQHTAGSFFGMKVSQVGGWATPLKNIKVSWDDYSQLYGQIKFMFQTTNQYIYIIIYIYISSLSLSSSSYLRMNSKNWAFWWFPWKIPSFKKWMTGGTTATRNGHPLGDPNSCHGVVGDQNLWCWDDGQKGLWFKNELKW